jgi:deoxyribonuclease-4
MPRFGAHLSIAGGVDQAALKARRIKADTLQLFVKSPSQWRFAALEDEQVRRFRAEARQANLAPLIAHASYLVNLASPDAALWEKSQRCALEEWDRAQRLGLDYFVVHPGAHMGSGEASGLDRIARALERLRHERPDHTVRILLETTAGAGTVLCGRIEHLGHLIRRCDPETGSEDRTWVPAGLAGPCGDFWLGVCIDTCHLWAAGYDLRTRQAIDDLLGRLDEAVGPGRVAVVHANDACGSLGSHLDRHEHIGRGRLGRETFRLLVHHPALAALPFILETPKEDARGRKMDPINLRTLRRLASE